MCIRKWLLENQLLDFYRVKLLTDLVYVLDWSAVAKFNETTYNKLFIVKNILWNRIISASDIDNLSIGSLVQVFNNINNIKILKY